jgi:nicotinamidase-related amidase
LTFPADTFESNPGLAERLLGLGVTEVVAIGIQSEWCVEATCKGALATGSAVTLLSEAHSTYDDQGKTAAEIEREVEGRLRDKGVRIVHCEEAVASWERKKKLS